MHENRTPDHLRDLQIDYIHNPLFDLKDADNIILGVLAQKSLSQARATVATGTNAKSDDLRMAPHARAIFRRFRGLSNAGDAPGNRDRLLPPHELPQVQSLQTA